MAGVEQTARRAIAPFDQGGELDLADLAFLGRVRTSRRNEAIHLLLDLLTLAFPVWKAPISHQLPQINSLIEKTLPTNRPLTTSRTWQIGFAGSSRVWLAAEVVAVSNDVRYGDAKRPSRRKARSTI
jgi:hypothetical protein